MIHFVGFFLIDFILCTIIEVDETQGEFHIISGSCVHGIIVSMVLSSVNKQARIELYFFFPLV